ncbi:putative Rhs-family protein [Cystobacter fuscus DSM 2262]|uniref:Rhs-family protein n=1 Tax=Cystobacter fuscus (strain ATCC 25194 / DSM 2262 / NBRC 100088 / M29) TaxID=1242864 RepID=S9PQC9_CYSF2|nr:HNH endonuclease [Cystobacter fuscus]EPX65241.1 putative Rhs-family protein [Cystobacter fuscus DSM 2262]WNG30037.1 HNH endonuclease [Cystobacter fuscus]
MGASLNSPQVKQQLDEIQADAKAASRELQLDIAQAALDAAGLVDPTPISDAAGALLSAARGDWFGAGMSLVSMIPYAGDAIGKTAKGAELLAKMARLKERIADNLVRAKQVVTNALKSDAASIRANKALAKAERIEDGLVNGCPVGGNRFGTQSPRNGWAGERGDSAWDPATSGMDADRLKAIESVTGGKPIPFEKGYPDFSDYTHQLTDAAGNKLPARVEIPMKGDNGVDFPAARQAMAERLGVEKFNEPRGYTWHHHPDGVTMELIPSSLHNNVPHSGGAALARDPGY